MNILIVSQIFETLEDNGSDRILFFARELVKRGNQVKVITGNFDYKRGCKRFDSKGHVFKSVSGIDVVYVPVYSNVRGSYFRRFIFFISFMLGCFRELMMSARIADVIWGISTPLTVPFICAIASKIRKVPLVVEITDVWPDAAIHTGVVKNKVLIELAGRMEKFCYKCAKRIVCLTEGIQQAIILKGVDASKTCLVTNGVDVDLFDKSRFTRQVSLRSSLGFDRKNVAMYIGALGKYNSLDTIIQAASILKDEDSLVFLIVGDGEQKDHLERLVADEQLDNVVFHPPIKRIDAPEFLSVADFFLLPNLAGDFFKGNLPNKTFDYLASGRPVIVTGQVEAGRLIEKIQAGFVVDAESPEQLAEVVLMVSKLNAVEREIIGSRGAAYVKNHYDRMIQADDIESVLKSVSVGSI